MKALAEELATPPHFNRRGKASANPRNVIITPPCTSCGAKPYHMHFSWCAEQAGRIQEAKVA